MKHNEYCLSEFDILKVLNEVKVVRDPEDLANMDYASRMINSGKEEALTEVRNKIQKLLLEKEACTY